MGDVIAMLSFCTVGLIAYFLDKPIEQWTKEEEQ